MSQVVLNAIAAEVAQLERIVPFPDPPYGYGRDLSCVTDITADLEEVDPFSPRGIGEALLRRLITPRGTLFDDLDYGFDVRGFVNRGTPESALRDLADAIRLEGQKDDRIETLAVAVTRLAYNALDIRLRVTPKDPDLEPFTFTFGIVNGALTLEAFG